MTMQLPQMTMQMTSPSTENQDCATAMHWHAHHPGDLPVEPPQDDEEEEDPDAVREPPGPSPAPIREPGREDGETARG